MNDAALAKRTEAALERALLPDQPGVRRLVPRTEPLPDNHLPPQRPAEKPPLEVLYELLSKTEEDVPRAGVESSAAMAGVFDQVCADIMKVAKDATDRAAALYQEASNFVTVVQESKRVMCSNIEDESRRAALGGIALREVAKILRGQG